MDPYAQYQDIQSKAPPTKTDYSNNTKATTHNKYQQNYNTTIYEPSQSTIQQNVQYKPSQSTIQQNVQYKPQSVYKPEGHANKPQTEYQPQEQQYKPQSISPYYKPQSMQTTQMHQPNLQDLGMNQVSPFTKNLLGGLGNL